jgi:hypothetical protein
MSTELHFPLATRRLAQEPRAMIQWFYAQNGQQTGPISEPELDTLVQNGQLTTETLVWREGMVNWQPYNSVRTPRQLSRDPAAPPVLDQAVCAECQRIFGKSDLLRYENAYVCAACKPAFFQKLQEGITPGGASVLWRCGKFLIMRKDATLPNRCVKCNADAAGYKLKRKLFWHHPALYLMIVFPGLLIYAIVATIVGKRARIEIGLCGEHRRLRSRNLLIAWLLFASCIICFVLAAWLSNGWMVFGGFVLLLASPVYGSVTCAMVSPKRINDQ